MMKILYTYIVKHFVKIFLLTIAAFSIVVIISTLFHYVNIYMEYKASFFMIMLHILSNIPEWLIQILPIATLLALLFSLGNLSGNNEMTAIKASGVNLLNIIILFIAIGIVIGIVDLSMREFIITRTSLYNINIKIEKIQKKKNVLQTTEFYNQVIPLEGNIRLIAGHLDTESKIMNNITIEKYDQNFVIKRLILAQTAEWKNNSWTFKNGIIRVFSYNNFWSEVGFKSYNSNIYIAPEDMTLNDKYCESMNIKQFKKHINNMKIFGASAAKERTIFNMRFAFPFAHVIVMMTGIPFAMNFNKKNNRILIFTLALIPAFLYSIVQHIFQSLGKNLVLHPFIAAWAPNIIFLALGIYLLSRVKR